MAELCSHNLLSEGWLVFNDNYYADNLSFWMMAFRLQIEFLSRIFNVRDQTSLCWQISLCSFNMDMQPICCLANVLSRIKSACYINDNIWYIAGMKCNHFNANTSRVYVKIRSWTVFNYSGKMTSFKWRVSIQKNYHLCGSFEYWSKIGCFLFHQRINLQFLEK